MPLKREYQEVRSLVGKQELDIPSDSVTLPARAYAVKISLGERVPVYTDSSYRSPAGFTKKEVFRRTDVGLGGFDPGDWVGDKDPNHSYSDGNTGHHLRSQANRYIVKARD